MCSRVLFLFLSLNCDVNDDPAFLVYLTSASKLKRTENVYDNFQFLLREISCTDMFVDAYVCVGIFVSVCAEVSQNLSTHFVFLCMCV